MLHSIKKASFKVAAKAEPEHEEFLELKQRIANMVKTLTESATQLDKAEMHWQTLFAEQKQTAENFANLYPDDDDLRKIAKTAVEVTAEVERSAAQSRESSTYVAINKQVKAFLAEYKTLESEYKQLTDAKTEFEMYRKKCDDLEKARRPDEERILRNATKFDEAKLSYEQNVETVIQHQKQFYAKRKEVFRAAFVSYWLAHGMHMDHLKAKIGPVNAYAKSCEKDLVNLNIASIRGDENLHTPSKGARLPRELATGVAL
ncbi:hypothetical protein FVE85_9479 [Porphyridium purpureum]|uniref:BAR domain-containing protein n=1 Tax=Porphyridium purpureum TaxID=35688 RepID=A0A5J4YK94_PORPP|nr:hypothetical protein FVE85_9479 [Porphyridium purpureum]|eukprot:POR9352..scf261_15